MARPLKNGLDYFPFDVDFFSDRKIKRLRARFGTDGLMVYIYLICEIYRSGYYIDINDDLILDISDEINISENATRQIIDFLLSRSLFNDKLAKSDKVLTATSIQKRYQEAKKGFKRDVEVEAKYWLLSLEDTYSFVKVRNNDSFSQKNPSKSEKNPTKESKINKNKLKEIRGERMPDGISHPPNAENFVSDFNQHGKYKHVKLTDSQYSELVKDFGQKKIDEYIKKVDEYCQQHNENYNDCDLTIRKWIAEDKGKHHEHSYDLDEFYDFTLNCVPEIGGKSV